MLFGDMIEHVGDGTSSPHGCFSHLSDVSQSTVLEEFYYTSALQLGRNVPRTPW
jgi:hypothetical protein